MLRDRDPDFCGASCAPHLPERPAESAAPLDTSCNGAAHPSPKRGADGRLTIKRLRREARAAQLRAIAQAGAIPDDPREMARLIAEAVAAGRVQQCPRGFANGYQSLQVQLAPVFTTPIYRG